MTLAGIEDRTFQGQSLSPRSGRKRKPAVERGFASGTPGSGSKIDLARGAGKRRLIGQRIFEHMNDEYSRLKCCRPLRGLETIIGDFPGAYAPGFTLLPASRA